VDGRLSYQIRTELENFDKNLPKNDTLARAVGLESVKKGARLLIESQLAQFLLRDYPEWLTHEGYITAQSPHPYSSVRYENILRRIAPTPEQDAYECLYFWICNGDFQHEDIDYELKLENFEEIRGMLGDTIGSHYKDTIELLKRCNKRQNFTRRILKIGECY